MYHLVCVCDFYFLFIFFNLPLHSGPKRHRSIVSERNTEVNVRRGRLLPGEDGKGRAAIAGEKISKTLRCLQELDITLEVLVGTGVGKTVNSFRKHNEVGDFAKSIVHQWKKLVPEGTENDQKSIPKQEPKKTLESKQEISKPKQKESGMEKFLKSEDNDAWNENLPESPTGGHKNTLTKTKHIKVDEKKPDYKEMKPKKVQEGKESKSEKAHSKGEKSKSSLISEKKTEKYSHSSHHEKKTHTKNEESPPEQRRRSKNNTSFPQSVEKTAETFSGEEFDAPTMSFESYLSYDQVSNKRKKKQIQTNETPKKVQVCKQYCNMKPSSSEVQKSTNVTKEEQDNDKEIKKRRFEDLINIPLPKFLPENSILLSPPHSSESKGNIPEPPTAEINPETSGFTGKRLNSKMLVYSGSKTIYLPKMLSLYQQCIRVLQNNIDSIQEVGGVPFEILQPVLERCTPEQLNRIEEYNPDFTEDSDHLWKKHCEKDFKGHKLLEYESWREMYLRLFSAREEKLKMITQNISSTYSGKPKGRQVKLAYIHGAAKPPRYIRRKQEINGTAGPIVQPHPIEKIKSQKIESKEPSISNSNVPVNNSQHGGPSHGGPSHGGPSQDTKKIVKKIAPMMAKSMRAFKNRVGPR